MVSRGSARKWHTSKVTVKGLLGLSFSWSSNAQVPVGLGEGVWVSQLLTRPELHV